MSPRPPEEHAMQDWSSDAALAALQTRPQGLTSDEARKRLERYGPNALTEHKQSLLFKLLGYFWGPIPWMIEVAALLSALVKHWADFAIILVLLLFNAAVGFWQEYQAGNAVEQLKKKLALKARVRRDGRWQAIEAQDLVPGDIVRLRLGDVIPADVKLIEGDYLSHRSVGPHRGVSAGGEEGRRPGLLGLGGQTGRDGGRGRGDRDADLLRQDRPPGR